MSRLLSIPAILHQYHDDVEITPRAEAKLWDLIETTMGGRLIEETRAPTDLELEAYIERVRSIKDFVSRRFPFEMAKCAYDALEKQVGKPQREREEYAVVDYILSEVLEKVGNEVTEHTYWDSGSLIDIDDLYTTIMNDDDLPFIFDLNDIVFSAMNDPNDRNDTSRYRPPASHKIRSDGEVRKSKDTQTALQQDPREPTNEIPFRTMVELVQREMWNERTFAKCRLAVEALATLITNIAIWLSTERLEVHERVIDEMTIKDTPGAGLMQNSQLKLLGLFIAELTDLRVLGGASPDEARTDLFTSGFTIDDLYRVIERSPEMGRWRPLKRACIRAGTIVQDFEALPIDRLGEYLRYREIEIALLTEILDGSSRSTSEEETHQARYERLMNGDQESDAPALRNGIEELNYIRSDDLLFEMSRDRGEEMRAHLAADELFIPSLGSRNAQLVSGGDASSSGGGASSTGEIVPLYRRGYEIRHVESKSTWYQGFAWLFWDSNAAHPERIGFYGLRETVINSLQNSQRESDPKVNSGRLEVIPNLLKWVREFARGMGVKEIVYYPDPRFGLGMYEDIFEEIGFVRVRPAVVGGELFPIVAGTIFNCFVLRL